MFKFLFLASWLPLASDYLNRISKTHALDMWHEISYTNYLCSLLQSTNNQFINPFNCQDFLFSMKLSIIKLHKCKMSSFLQVVREKSPDSPLQTFLNNSDNFVCHPVPAAVVNHLKVLSDKQNIWAFYFKVLKWNGSIHPMIVFECIF